MSPAVPVRIQTGQQVTPEWLSARFEAGGISARFREATVRRCIQTSSGIVYFIEASAAASVAPQFLVLKVYHPDCLHAGLNEVLLYQHFFIDHGSLPSPNFYDSYVDMDGGYCHVMTADLTPTHEMCERRRLGQQYGPIVRTLAQLHARWWEDENLSRDFMVIPQGGPVSMIQATTRTEIERVALWILDELIPKFCDKFEEHLPHGWRDLLEAAAGTWPDVFGERIEHRRRLTLLHGDTNWANIYLPRRADGDVRLIDWECFKCGPPAYDVAYLLISARSLEQRRRIEQDALVCYMDSLAEAGVTGYNYDHLLADYRISVVANLFVALAWGRLQAMSDSMAAFLDWDGPSLVR